MSQELLPPEKEEEFINHGEIDKGALFLVTVNAFLFLALGLLIGWALWY
jgi:hypothetical protein